MKLLAMCEASRITGPVKNLLEFQRCVGAASGGDCLELALLTFERLGSGNGNSGNGAKAASGGGAFVAAARKAGIRVDVLVERHRFDLRILTELKRAAWRISPDLIQTHAVKSHFLVRLTGLYRVCPWIAFHHGYTATDLKMRLYNQLDRWSLRKASRIVAVSDACAHQLRSAGIPPDRIEVVHNAIDPDWGAPPPPGELAFLRGRLGLPEGDRVLLSVGRLSYEKGHSCLIEAFALFRKEHPDVRCRLVLVGDGPERIALEARVNALGLSGMVCFEGYKERIAPYYHVASIFVLPSRSEGSPNALLEAMASGLPIVAARAGGVPELVAEGESAVLVEPSNPRALACAIGDVLLDPGRSAALAKNALRTVRERYHPLGRARRLVEIYEKIAARPAAGRTGLGLLLKQAVCALYLYCGWVTLRDAVLSLLGRSRVVVLCYHRIGGCDSLSRPEPEFQKDLGYLKRKYRCMRLDELCDRLRKGMPFRKRVVVITFDDGYRDNYTRAVPALLDAGVPAAFFVSTGFVGTDRVFAHDAVRSRNGGGAQGGICHPNLTWRDLRIMERAGFEIGSHTVNHVNLGRASADTARHEICESLAALDRELGARPRAFAFPWGKPEDASEEALRMVKDAGYEAALWVNGAPRGGVRPFRICRLDAGNGKTPRLAFYARVAGMKVPDIVRL